MFHAIKSVLTYPASSFPRALSPSLGRQTSSLRFRQVTSTSSQPDTAPDNMDKSQKKNPNEKFGNVMSHSFGEGYSTRSDEEGFGGTYGGNESASKIETDNFVHENHPDDEAYDKTQGSEVKEKEISRHQTSANA